MPETSPSVGYGTLAALLAVIAVSVWLGALAQRAVEKASEEGSFLKSYFLGNRGLGAWTLALTATVQSGGTFMGFPSLVYSYGWIVALWIGSYMIVPLTGFGVLGKRFAQISRRTGAITVPDLFRERFASPTVGLTASLLIMFFMSAMMVAQFKSGALIMKISWPGTGALALSEDGTGGIDRAYYVGLAVFSLTVVGYTLIGGFLASVWTDLFQSVLMFVGVLVLLALAVPAAGGVEQATLTAVKHTGPEFAFGPGFSRDGREFLTVGLAWSFFVVWIWGGIGSPASMVRIMATKDTTTIRRSIFLLATYNCFIYLPLLAICVSARALMPNLKETDEVIPRLALLVTRDLPGGSLVAGMILAAPFGAVMATVSSYLVVIASGIVRDVYQRFINRAANQMEIRRLTYVVTFVVGAAAVAANIYPVRYLQAIVVFSTSGAAACFVVPAMMAAYWRRATAPGVLAAMLCGGGTTLGLFITGWILSWRGFDPGIGVQSDFRGYYLLGLEPIVWGLPVSLIAGVLVSLKTRPPDPQLVARMFDAQPQMGGAKG